MVMVVVEEIGMGNVYYKVFKNFYVVICIFGVEDFVMEVC